MIEQAIRLDPNYGTLNSMAYGIALFVLGQYEKALSYFDMGIKENPNFLGNNLFRTSPLGLLEYIEEAQSSTTELLKINPNFAHLAASYFNDKHLAEVLTKGLHKAGLKDLKYIQ